MANRNFLVLSIGLIALAFALGEHVSAKDTKAAGHSIDAITVDLDPTIREGGDKGLPVALAGPESKLAAEFYAVARRVVDKAREAASKSEDVLEIS